MKRSLQIDAMKGFGILLVVLGHCLQGSTPYFDDNVLYRLIYSFHMPLFIFLSGCVARPDKLSSIKKNFLRLGIPFICWYLVAYVVLRLEGKDIPPFGEFIWRWIKSPDYGLWFLWVLFLCHAVSALLYQLYIRVHLAAALIGLVVVYVLQIHMGGYSLFKLHFPYFIAGYFAMRYHAKLWRYRLALMTAAPWAFAMLFPFWYRTDDIVLFQSAEIILPTQVMQHFGGIIAKLYRYATAFAGIGVAYGIVYFLRRLPVSGTVLCWLGLYTFDIYVVHQLLLSYGFGSGIVLLLSNGLIALALSLALGFVLKKIPIINSLLYGSEWRTT